jgi:hypothetical protein
MFSIAKEKSREIYNLSKAIKTVQKTILKLGSKEIRVLGAPEGYIYYEKMHEEPLMQELSKHTHDLVAIQYDPMNTIAKFRHLGQRFVSTQPGISQAKEAFEFEVPVVTLWEECQASLAIQNFLQKLPVSQTDQIKSIYTNVIGNQFIRYPYINSSVVLSAINSQEPVLIDVPEPLLRINIANSCSIEQIRAIYHSVINSLQSYYSKSPQECITGYDIANDLHPEIFQSPRNVFAVSFLQHLASDHNLIAVVSPSTFIALSDLWEKPINFKQLNVPKDKIVGDTHHTLIEKHVILDVIMNTKTWNVQYLKNRFVYLDKSDNISLDMKNKYKSIFFEYYQKYNRDMIKIIQPILDKINA